MSDRDKALYHLHQWWLAGNDETLHHAGAELLKVMEDCGWVQEGKRQMAVVWENDGLTMCADTKPVTVHCLSYLGRIALMDWMRAKWTSSRPGRTIEQMKEAIGHD
jgi:hypothetical protein